MTEGQISRISRSSISPLSGVQRVSPIGPAPGAFMHLTAGYHPINFDMRRSTNSVQRLLLSRRWGYCSIFQVEQGIRRPWFMTQPPLASRRRRLFLISIRFPSWLYKLYELIAEAVYLFATLFQNLKTFERITFVVLPDGNQLLVPKRNLSPAYKPRDFSSSPVPHTASLQLPLVTQPHAHLEHSPKRAFSLSLQLQHVVGRDRR